MPAGIGLLIMISCQTAISQNCQCKDSDGNPIRVFLSDTVSKKYMSYYDTIYRRGTRKNIKKHSESVDFSKKAFKNFYQAFGGEATQYAGVAFNFISFNNRNGREGQLHRKQISLLLSPASCVGDKIKPEDTEYMIRNNSYNRNRGNYTPNQEEYKVIPSLAKAFKTKYERNYHTSVGNKNKYTKFLFLDKEVIAKINELLTEEDEKYAGIRVFFASYNKNVVCRQADDTQITLLIAPILTTTGDADFSVWNDPSAWPPEAWNKLKEFNTVNHGALCPNNCN